MKAGGSAAGGPLYIAVALLGAVGLAYELVLMRIFSITQWHHFAYMIISIAMLGFGSAGTVLALVSARIKGREREWLGRASAGFAFSVPACYILGQRIPFETFHLTSSPLQLIDLLLLYLVLSFPFFLCAACINLALLLRPAKIGPLYGVNMVGSAAGVLFVTLLLFRFSPASLPALLSLPAVMAMWLLLRPLALKWKGLLAAGVAALAVLSLGVPPRVSDYKGMSYVLQFPDSRVVARAGSPMSEVTAVASSLIRETPGQLSGYPMDSLGPLPEQVGLFFDAGSMSVINRFDGDLSSLAFLDYVTAALPYHLVERPRTLVAGAGGGTDVLMALAHGAPEVTAVEVDPSVFPLIEEHFDAFSGGLYRRPDVRAVHAEARHFLQAARCEYDLLHISLMDAFAASASGVYALSENYMYTREALQLYLQRLSPRGILSITRWIKTPPRDTLKLFATAVEALEAEGVADPAAHLLWIRSWNTATVLAARRPWSARQLAAAEAFCETRGFDLCYAPGLSPDRANRFTILPRPLYYEAAQALLSGDRLPYYRNFLFHIRPATDDCPYFFRFFKWTAIRRLLGGMGTEWIPFVEWGYLALLATLAQGAAAAFICILAPLLAFRRKGIRAGSALPGMLYFGCLGLAYMFVEIAFIQKIMLFLAYPIYAVAVVLFSFLFCSGLGAAWSSRRVAGKPRRLRYCIAGLLAFLAGIAVILQIATPLLMSWPETARICAALLLPAPVAFFMGVPFPSGLGVIGSRQTPFIPWAWGVNGVLSVVAAPVAMLIAMHAGLTALVGIAAGLYLLAAILFPRI